MVLNTNHALLLFEYPGRMNVSAAVIKGTSFKEQSEALYASTVACSI